MKLVKIFRAKLVAELRLWAYLLATGSGRGYLTYGFFLICTVPGSGRWVVAALDSIAAILARLSSYFAVCTDSRQVLSLSSCPFKLLNLNKFSGLSRFS